MLASVYTHSQENIGSSGAISGAEEILRVRNLSKTYLTRTGAPIIALNDVSLTLRDGEFVSIVGPSGCGKSTLLKLIAGLYRYTSGEILYRNQTVSRPQKGMGIVFQTPVLLPWLTVFENVLLPIKILRKDNKIAAVRARSLLALVGLADFEAKYPSELSGGMQQRVGIIRSLIHDPSVLLMDEPFGALDALTRERMGIELQRIWMDNRKTVFFITHSILEAVFLSDRVLVMSERPGRIVQEFIIPFTRPRQFKLTTDSEFGSYVSEIRTLLGATVND